MEPGPIGQQQLAEWQFGLRSFRQPRAASASRPHTSTNSLSDRRTMVGALSQPFVSLAQLFYAVLKAKVESVTGPSQLTRAAETQTDQPWSPCARGHSKRAKRQQLVIEKPRRRSTDR